MICLWISVILACGILCLADAAEMVSTSDDPDYDKWMMEALVSDTSGKLYQEFTNSIRGQAVYLRMGEALLEDQPQIYMSSAWSFMFNAEFRNHIVDNAKFAYQCILLNYLKYGTSLPTSAKMFAASEVKYTKTLYSKLADYYHDAVLVNLNSLSNEEAKSVWSRVTDVEQLKDAIKEVYDGAKTVKTLIEEISTYLTLQEVRNNRIALIRASITAAGNENNTAYIDAANEVIDLVEGDVSHYVFSRGTQFVANQLLNEAWGQFAKRNSVAGLIDFEVQGLDYLFGTTEKAGNDLKLLFLYNVDKYMKSGTQIALSDYSNSGTSSNARKMRECFEGYVQFQMFGDTFAKSWIDTYINSGAFSVFFNSQSIQNAYDLRNACNNQISIRNRVLEIENNLTAIYENLYPHIYNNGTSDSGASGESGESGEIGFTVNQDFESFVPFLAYPLSDEKNTTVYTQYLQAYSPNTACIYPDDLCVIEKVYTNGYCKVTYSSSTSSSGERTEFARMDDFIPNYSRNCFPEQYKTFRGATAYRRCTGNASIGSVFQNDTCLKVASVGRRIQVIYRTSSSCKMGWITGVCDAPSDFSVESDGMWAADLSWDRVDGATGYRIERKSYYGKDDYYSTITTVDSNSDAYHDTGLRTGYKYYYRIFAVNSFGVSDPAYCSVLLDVYPVTLSSTLEVSEGYYRIRNRGTDYSLSIERDSDDDLANVHIWNDSVANAYEVWKLTYKGNGYYTLTNFGSGKVLDVAGAYTMPGSNVGQYTSNGTNAQLWNIVSTGQGNSYFLIPKLATRFTLLGGDSQGDNVCIYPRNGEANQQFDLIPQSITVTFDANGGSVSISHKEVVNTEKYGTLPTPTKSGKIFIGWYTSTSGGTRISENTTVNCGATQTLYAHWKYIVYYDANGGIGAPEAQTQMDEKDTITLSNIKPTREGYDFLGWRAMDKDYKPGQVYDKKQTTTMWAVWGNKVAYNINDNPDDSLTVNRGNVPESFIRPAGETVHITTAKPSLEGYDFLGWKFTDHDGKEHILQPGDEYRWLYVKTLWAVWGNKVAYNINDNPDDSLTVNRGNVPESFIRPAGETVHITTAKPSLEGYDFLGWKFTDHDGKEHILQPGDEYRWLYVKTLWAVWGNKVAYNINDNPDDSLTVNRGNVPESFIRPAGETVHITTAKPSLEGYDFLGWKFTDHDGKEHILQPGDEYRWLYVKTLWAVWGNKVAYNINDNPDDSLTVNRGNVPESFIRPAGETVHITTAKPSLEGYDFLGWKFTDHDGKEHILQPGDDYRWLYAKTLWAVWGNTVSYNANGGSRGDVPESFIKWINYSVQLTSCVPVRPGYKFLGWAKNKTASIPDYVSGSQFTENLITTLYAVWEEDSSIMRLPETLQVIEAEAFMDSGLSYIEIPSTVNYIGERAFADNPAILAVYVYTKNTTISKDAFSNSPGVMIYGYEGSDIETYCSLNSIPFSIIE